jgi:hypothetical protein
VFANATARDVAIPSPTTGQLCQLTDTDWLWWFRNTTVRWVPVQASIASTPSSYGGWTTAGAVAPAAQQNIGAYFAADNPLYTTATGCRYTGRYTLKVYFGSSNSDPGIFTILSNLGGSLNVSSSQMSWAVATSVATATLGYGNAIYYQFVKNTSQVAWPSSTFSVMLSYQAV